MHAGRGSRDRVLAQCKQAWCYLEMPWYQVVGLSFELILVIEGLGLTA